MDRNGVNMYSCVCKVQPVLMSVDAARRTEAGLKSISDGQRCIECKYTAKEVKYVATLGKSTESKVLVKVKELRMKLRI